LRGRQRQIARLHRLSVHQHSAGAALAETTAKTRAFQLEVVAQHIEQRRFRLGTDLVSPPVDVQSNGHSIVLGPGSRMPPGLSRKNSKLFIRQSGPIRPAARTRRPGSFFENDGSILNRVYVGMEERSHDDTYRRRPGSQAENQSAAIGTPGPR